MATQQPHIVVHWLENSRAQRIVWLLEELKLSYEIKVYRRLENQVAPPELKQIHPLGKSPVISLQLPDRAEPVVIAETAVIIEYLSERFGQHLIPSRWQAGKEDTLAGETESWLRYRYLMHYTEGSLAPFLLVKYLFQQINGPEVPWLARPITSKVSKEVGRQFIDPNIKNHLDFLEAQLATSPESGTFLTGPRLTGADILISFPILALKERSGVDLAAEHPKVLAYTNQFETIPTYQAAIKRVEKETGEPYTLFSVTK